MHIQCITHTNAHTHTNTNLLAYLHSDDGSASAVDLARALQQCTQVIGAHCHVDAHLAVHTGGSAHR